MLESRVHLLLTFMEAEQHVHRNTPSHKYILEKVEREAPHLPAAPVDAGSMKCQSCCLSLAVVEEQFSKICKEKLRICR